MVERDEFWEPTVTRHFNPAPTPATVKHRISSWLCTEQDAAVYCDGFEEGPYTTLTSECPGGPKFAPEMTTCWFPLVSASAKPAPLRGLDEDNAGAI